MFELRAAKTVKSCILCILLSLAIIKISIFTAPLGEQGQAPTSMVFPIRTASDPNAFLTVWDTTKISIGSSNSDQVHLPLQSNGIYNFFVSWGDGSNDTITLWNQSAVTHTYVSLGIHTINITGTIVGWQFNYGGDRLKIVEIQQWGCLQLGNSGNYFCGCFYLKLTAIDSLNLTGTTSLNGCFENCWDLGSNGNMNGWDTSRVTDMRDMFYWASSFNQPIGNWNVSSVTNMGNMFYQATSFNQSIGDWDVSNVIFMTDMFSGASSFNQPIGNWNVSSVAVMSRMFSYASSFNQPIGNWNVSSVKNMPYMFFGASSFNQPIGNWDVSSVTLMYYMFCWASSFNQPIGDWDVSSVTNMQYMFAYASSFNQPISNWNVSSVTDMSYMFYGVTLSTSNYDNLLIGWSQLSLQHGVSFDGGNSKYSNAAVNARQTLITNFGWTITDGGLEAPSISGYNLIVFGAVLGVIIVLIIFLKGNKKEYF